MKITLYTKPGCVQCAATHRAFDTKGIEHVEVDVTEDFGALEHIKSLGYRQAPVIIAGAEHWSGFRPDKIDELAKRLEDPGT